MWTLYAKYLENKLRLQCAQNTDCVIPYLQISTSLINTSKFRQQNSDLHAYKHILELYLQRNSLLMVLMSWQCQKYIATVLERDLCVNEIVKKAVLPIRKMAKSHCPPIQSRYKFTNTIPDSIQIYSFVWNNLDKPIH